MPDCHTALLRTVQDVAEGMQVRNAPSLLDIDDPGLMQSLAPPHQSKRSTPWDPGCGLHNIFALFAPTYMTLPSL